MPDYFAAYSRDFKGDASSRKAWMDERKGRISSKRNIRVVLKDIDVTLKGDNIVPEFLEIDVTPLEIGQALHLSDVRFPEGVVPTEKDLRMTLAAVHTPKAEVVAKILADIKERKA